MINSDSAILAIDIHFVGFKLIKKKPYSNKILINSPVHYLIRGIFRIFAKKHNHDSTYSNRLFVSGAVISCRLFLPQNGPPPSSRTTLLPNFPGPVEATKATKPPMPPTALTHLPTIA